MQTADLLRLKEESLKRFAVIRGHYGRMMKALARNGSRSPAYLEAREDISNELMNIRFSAKQIEALCDSVRRLVEEIRRYERSVLDLCVNKANMPRAADSTARQWPITGASTLAASSMSLRARFSAAKSASRSGVSATSGCLPTTSVSTRCG